MERLTRLFGVVTAVLIATSGALMYAAAWERWWPACPRGAFDSDRCVQLQDHLYDFAWPADPWVSVGDAAVLAGLSYLVLAVALAGLPTVMLGRRHRLLNLVSVVVLSGGALVFGLVALLSGLSGQPELQGWWLSVAGVVWALGLPAMLITLGVVAAHDDRPGYGWRWLAVFLLLGSSPLGLVFAGPIGAGYASYDTSPWTEAVGAFLLVVAAPALWRAGVLGRRQRAVVPDANGRDVSVHASDAT